MVGVQAKEPSEIDPYLQLTSIDPAGAVTPSGSSSCPPQICCHCGCW